MGAKRGAEENAAAQANGVSSRTRSKAKAGSGAGGGSGAAISEQAARVKAAREQAAAASRAARQQAAPKPAPSSSAAAASPLPPPTRQHPPAPEPKPAQTVDVEAAARAAQALRIEQEGACIGQLRVLCGSVDGLPPGDLKFLLTMRLLAPLWLPGWGDIVTVDDAQAALGSLLEQGSAAKLSTAEETPVARKALLSFLQSCM